MIEIIEVKTKKQIREFCDFPLKLYKGNKYFVPPLYMDELKLFTNKNVYHDQAEDIFYLAKKGKNVVGRIQGILQKVSNQKENTKRVRFTRFDCIDDQEVANALFSAIESWAGSKQMNEIVGPLGYSDLDREGLLIEGFDQPQTFEEQYNYPYYQKLIENCGYVKEVDWLESQLRLKKDNIDPANDRLHRLSKVMMKRCKLHFGEAKNTNDFLRKYGTQFFEILDKTYANIYGTVPFTPAMKDMLIDNFKLIIDLRFVKVILDENNKVVCFGLAFPSFGHAIKKSGGHLTLPAIIRILKAIKHPKVLDLGLIGVLPEYAMMGIASSILCLIEDSFVNYGVEYAETNLNLETNDAILSQWKNFDQFQNKKRRCFVKKIG